MKFRFFLSTLLLFAFAASFASAKPTKTTVNLKDAIKGETTASAKYSAYAKKAREEGFSKIAVLFEAASKSEGIHAANHRAVLEDMGESMAVVKPEFTVKSTKENLQDAIKGESYEVTTMYPEFLKTASAEKATLASVSMNYAYRTEQRHKALYEKALQALGSKKESSLSGQYLVCPTCGNTYEGNAPARCGICMTGKDRYITVK
ncbi:MAG: rubrerythrin family protein [Bacteroidetes bacterium]|nr:rubrerythrin family protein [Bacteroidota bacterium]